MAGKTKCIRLGTATTILSSDDPVRVFQRFSTLNAVSRGRAEIILGRGWFAESFALFGHNIKDYDSLFDEKLELFSRLLRNDVINWKGKTRPPLTDQRVFPRIEAQAPSTWVAVGATPESAIRAARYDMPVMLAVIGGEPERFRPLIEIYRLASEKLKRPLQAIGIHSSGYVCDTDERAQERFWRYYKPMRDRLGSERSWPPFGLSQFKAEVAKGSLFVGSPETVARRIAHCAKNLSISRFNLRYSAGRMPHPELLDSIALFGRKVIPIVRELLS